MPNPFNMNNNFNPYMNNNNEFRNLYRAMCQSNNPYQMFMNLAGNNPNMQPIINAMQNGINPQQIFNTMCQQRGINPNQFLKSITG